MQRQRAAVNITWPPNVSAPLSVVKPGPFWMSPPTPEMTPLNDALPLPETVSRPGPMLTPPETLNRLDELFNQVCPPGSTRTN